MNGPDTVGIVGLGSLGLALARRLLAKDIAVVGYKRSASEQFTAQGGTLLGSPADVFAAARIIFTCLSDDDALDDVVAGPQGFLASKATGRIVVDCSTSDLRRRENLAERLREAGSNLVDCPISGSPIVVADGRAALLVSGDRDCVAAALPFLECISNQVLQVGPFGAGTKLKYLANFLFIINAAAAAEAITLAGASGLDARAAVDVLTKTAGNSYQLTSRGPNMASRTYPTAATLDALTKDMHLIETFAAANGVESHLFAAAAELVERARSRGFGHHDPTSLIEGVDRRES